MLKLIHERANDRRGGRSASQRRAIPRLPRPPSRDALGGWLKREPGPVAERLVRAVFREFMSGCRALVRPLRIALPGAALQL